MAEQPPPPSASRIKLPNAQPYYNYQPLREGWIRLVRIRSVPSSSRRLHPPDDALEADIHVVFEEYSLQNCPTYIALSYTWGNATVTDPTSTVFTTELRCYPIFCERELLRTTRNLRDALRRLRGPKHTRVSSETKTTSKFLTEAFENTDLYWIDALCVDQDDLAERAAQVALMSKIYGQASSCIVFLGESDEHSMVALELVHRFAEDKSLSDFTHSNENRAKDKVALRLNGLPRYQRHALSMLLARRYFNRIWVLQEIMLASRVIGLLGSLAINFEVLFTFGQLLLSAKTDRTCEALDNITVESEQLAVLEGDGPFPFQAVMNMAMVLGARMSFHRGDTPSLIHIVPMSFMCRVTDQRDRVYGILAISAELQENDRPNIPVDYNLPVDQVYINATVAFSLRRNDLEFLALVGEHAKVNITLPSWCPDYSTRYFWLRALGGAVKWHFGPLWTFPATIEFRDNRKLIVQGIHYDTLAGTATTGLFDPTDTLRCVKPSQLLGLALNLRREASQSVSIRSTTRIEMLWRLLFMPDFLSPTRAPRCTVLFLPNLIIQIMLLHIQWWQKVSGVSPRPDSQSSLVTEEVEATEDIINRICHLEPQSTPFLPVNSAWRLLLTAKADDHSVHRVLLTSIMDRAKQSGLTSELRDLLSSIPGDELPTAKHAGLLEKFLSTAILGKLGVDFYRQSYFSTTQSGQFGIGYASIAAGDEVWLLHGHSAPVVLRRLSNGNYRFLGETYIPGMMSGELAEELKATTQPIEGIQIE